MAMAMRASGRRRRPQISPKCDLLLRFGEIWDAAFGLKNARCSGAHGGDGVEDALHHRPIDTEQLLPWLPEPHAVSPLP